MNNQTVAEEFERNKQWDKAIEKYKEIYRADESLYILSKLLWCYSRANNYTAAKKCGEQLLVKEPNNPKWLYMTGYQYYMEKDWSSAIEYYEKALRVYPEYFVVLYRAAYANLQIAGEYMKLTKSEYWKAIGYLNKAHDIWSNFSDEEKQKEKDTYFHICFLHGKAFMQIPNRNNEAIKLFYNALEIKEELNCRYNLCKSLLFNKDYEQAKQALPKSHKYYIVELEAQIEYHLSNYDRAISLIGSIIQKQKKDYLYCLLSEIYTKQNEYKKAIEAASIAIKINSKNHKNHYALAKVFYAVGLFLHALNEIEQAQNLKQKRYNTEYKECHELKDFIINHMGKDYIEDEDLFNTLSINTLTGKLREFDYKKKYGFVYIDDKKVFVHISNVISGHLKNGVLIEFSLVETSKGYQANNIFVK